MVSRVRNRIICAVMALSMLLTILPIHVLAQTTNDSPGAVQALATSNTVPVPIIWDEEIVDKYPRTPGLQATIHGVAAPGLTVKIVRSNDIDNPIATTKARYNSAWQVNVDLTDQSYSGMLYAIAENRKGETSPLVSQLTRAQMAQLVVAIAGFQIDVSGPTFSDIASSYWAYQYIMTARNNGIMSGYVDGAYYPERHISKAEAARAICLAKGLPYTNNSMPSFSDVTSNYWAYKYIDTLESYGILYGNYDGTFRPNSYTIAGPIEMSGYVTGQVKDSEGLNPLGGILVTAYPVNYDGTLDNLGMASQAYTNADGSYWLYGLDGSYKIRFGLPYDMTGDANADSFIDSDYENASPYESEFYDNQINWDDASDLMNFQGWNIDSIDANLSKGATISGTAESEDSLPISGINVDAFNLEGVWAGGALTDSKGQYSIIGLSAGQYKVHIGNHTTSGDARRFSKNDSGYSRTSIRYRVTDDASAFIGKWSNEKSAFDDANTIEVRAQESIENTDFKVERAINTTITSPQNNATLSATVPIDIKIEHANTIERVTLYVDGMVAARSDSGAEELSFNLNTTKYLYGQHEIIARSYDIFGNAAYDKLSVIFGKSSGNSNGDGSGSRGSGGGGGGSTTTRAPAKPQNLRGATNSGVIELAWDANKESDIAGYNIYRAIKGKNDAPVKLNTGLITETKFNDASAGAGISYLYYVTAVNKANQESEKSAGLELALTMVKSAVVFSDITSGSWYAGPVSDLISRGIIKGFADGTFKPTKSITREEFAKIICLAMNWTLTNPDKPSFSDVAKNRWSYAYIETAKAHGVISGYPNGMFIPDKNISRAELAVISVKAKGFTLDTGEAGFADVNSSDWSNRYILTAKNKGIVKGTGNLFNPNCYSSRAEAAVMVYRLIGQ